MGRRVLIVGGALIVALSTACYGLVHELWFLVVVRIVTGFGEAGFFVGAATMITDLAPSDRRGEAVSYWSVAVYGGLSFGPVLGSVLHGKHHYGSAWIVSAVLAFIAAIIGLFTVEVERSTPVGATAPAAPLGDRAGHGAVPRADPARGLHRVRAALRRRSERERRRDLRALRRADPRRAHLRGAGCPTGSAGATPGTLALVVVAVGIGLIAAWPTVVGLVVGTIVFAAGMSLMYPALLLLALDGVSDAERASVVGTFSSFFDLSQGLGAFICGTVVALRRRPGRVHDRRRSARSAGSQCCELAPPLARRHPRRVGPCRRCW